MAPSRSILLFWACALSVLARIAPGAETPAEPVQFVGPDPAAVIRLNDVSRTLERLRGSPYPSLARTAWGALATTRLQRLIAPHADDAAMSTLAASIRCAAIGIDAGEGAEPDVRVAVAVAGDAAPMRDLCRSVCDAELPGGDQVTRWQWPCGQVVQLDNIFAFGWSSHDVVQRPGPAPAAGTPESCVEMSIEPMRLLRVMLPGGLPPGIAPAVPADHGPPLVIGVSLDPIGLREHWNLPIGDIPVLPAARVELFDSLPTTTLMALTFHAEPGASGRLLWEALEHQPMLRFRLDLLLAQWGLPSLQLILSSVTGDTLIYLEDGAPFPYVTIALGMTEDLARAMLPMIAMGVDMSAGPGGVLTGFLGKVPCQAGYLDGQLVVTTNPAGVPGYAHRTGGFTAAAEVAHALAELPDGALVAGVSSSGRAASAIMRTALMSFAHIGLPQLSTLPQDVATAARHGFLAVSRRDGALVLDAGGLIGGPLTAYGLLSSAAYANYRRVVHIMEQQAQELQERHGRPPGGSGSLGKTM
ncbi:MAG: hypothetical protein H0W83_12295 [Planctomycetes bacterium]|nr:hypothetical protein [Planctomycetota bacterium]